MIRLPVDGARARVTSFRGLSVLANSAWWAATTMPRPLAWWIYVLAIVSNANGGLFPVTAALAATAAAVSVVRASGGGMGGLFLGLVVVAPGVASDGGRGTVFATATALVAAVVAAIVDVRRSHPKARPDDPGATFATAAQTHSWTLTCLLALLAFGNAFLAATAVARRERAPLAALAPAGSLAVTVLLSGRGAHLLGRLAPLALAVPLAAGTHVAWLVVFERVGGSDLWTVVAAASGGACWITALSYSLVRRHRASSTQRALACAWGALTAAAVFGYAAYGRDGSRDLTLMLTVGWVAFLPYVLSAAAELRTKTWVRFALCALILVLPALAVTLAAPDVPRFGRVDVFGIRWREPGDAPEFRLVLRLTELGLLFALAGIAIRRARSLTAIPRGHPVFTEGPHVPRTVRFAASADAAPRVSLP